MGYYGHTSSSSESYSLDEDSTATNKAAGSDFIPNGFICAYCSERYAEKVELVKHLFSIHSTIDK